MTDLAHISLPLLTIAIPTYNRGRNLEQLLKNLESQIKGNTAIEIIVSDNASEDCTKQIVSSFQEAGMHIRYIRNKTNVGADGNILQCFRESNGKYVWIFGDDDVLKLGAINLLLPLLSEEEYDLIHLNTDSVTEICELQSAKSPLNARVVHSAVALSSRVNIFFTFISGNIINKDRVNSLPHRPFIELIGTSLVQLSWVYPLLEHHRKSLVIESTLVSMLTGNTGGYSLFETFGPNLNRITESLLSNRATKRPITNAALQRFFPYFIFCHRNGSWDFLTEDPRPTLHNTFRNNWRYWIFDYPIMYLPLNVAKVCLKVTRLVNRLDRIFGDHILRS